MWVNVRLFQGAHSVRRRMERRTHRLDDASVWTSTPETRSVVELFLPVPHRDPHNRQPAVCPPLTRSHASCWRSGIFFSSAAPHCKTDLPDMFLCLLEHVAEAAISWQRCHTGSRPGVCGYVTADEAIIWRGVKKINPTLDYKETEKTVPALCFHSYVTSIL